MPSHYAQVRLVLVTSAITAMISLCACHSRPAATGDASAAPASPTLTRLSRRQSGPAPEYRRQPATPDEDVLTYHNSAARTGLQSHETILTPANVNPSTFGRLFADPVDGFVYAQPLYVAGVSIPGKGRINVVYVATENDSLYAFDADRPGPPLWHKNLAQGGSPVSSVDVSCGQIVPRIGITGTPVIDPSTGTLYVVALVKHSGAKGNRYAQTLHAIDIATGAEKFGGPVTIRGSVPGTGAGSIHGAVSFDAFLHVNRPGLALANGVVYIGFGSHCDLGNYHGWLFAYDARRLALRGVLNTTPNGSQGAIWQTGDAPAVDTEGHVFILTGNGTFDANSGRPDYGDSFVKLALFGNSLRPIDFFTPFNQKMLDAQDLDVGSGGPVLIPDPSGLHGQIVVGAGKNAVLYIVKGNRMGHFQPNGNGQIAQEIEGPISANFSTPAYWNGHLYVGSIGKPLQEYLLANGHFSASPVSQSPDHFNYPGTTPGVSSDGDKNAIVWALENGAYQSGGPAVLRAYDATDLTHELYSSAHGTSGGSAGPAVKFTTPTIAHGRVYFGTENALDVYGLLH